MDIAGGFHHAAYHYFYFMMQVSSHCQTLWQKWPLISSFCVGYPDTLFDSSAITFISQVVVIIIEGKNNNKKI